MFFQGEFVHRVNESVEFLAGQRHNGEEIVVLIPVPKEFSIDCSKIDGINLDNAKVSISGEQRIKDENGNVVIDADSMGAVLYKITGIVRDGG